MKLDFIVKYREKGKRLRQLSHIHWSTDLLLKCENNKELVMKVIKKRYPEISLNELVNIFEQGITGDFGKVYSADPETLLDWVRTYTNRKGQQRYALLINKQEIDEWRLAYLTRCSTES